MTGKARVLHVSKPACFALLVLVLAAGSLLYQYRYLRPSDDYFWLMFLSHNFIEGAQGERLYERYSDLVHQPGYTREAVARMEARVVLDDNYLSQAFVFAPFVLVARSLPISIEAKTVFVMFGGFITMYALVSCLLLLVMWRTNDATLVFSLFLAITLIYFIDFQPRPQVYNHFHPGVEGVDLLEQIRHFFARIFHPGPKYVIFNFAPKDRLMVLVTALLLLRWAGRVRLTYLLMPLLFLIHVEYTGLILVLFLGIDLLVRPRVVMGSWIAPWGGLWLGVFVVVSALGRRLDVAPWFAAVPVVLGLASILAMRLAPARLQRCFEGYEAFVGRFSRPVQDVAAFAIVWVMSLAATYVMYRLGGETLEESGTHLSNFLWLLVPTRFLGFFALAILTVAIWMLLRRFSVEIRWRGGKTATPPGWRAYRGVAVAALAALAVLLPAAKFALDQGGTPWGVALRKTEAVEASLAQPVSAATWHSDEVKVFYAMFTSLLSDDDRLGQIGVP